MELECAYWISYMYECHGWMDGMEWMAEMDEMDGMDGVDMDWMEYMGGSIVNQGKHHSTNISTIPPHQVV